MNPLLEMHIGDAIRTVRNIRGLSLRELARAIDVSAATLSAIENNKTGISVARLHVIAGVLGTTADQLLRYEAREDTAAPNHTRGTTLAAQEGDWRHYRPLDIDSMLRAAIVAFVETGYHGATMRMIARLAQISVPGLYHHYASKQTLLVRILDLTMSELRWRIAAACTQGVDSVERISLFVECLALFHMHRRELAFLGASEMRSLEPSHRRRIARRRTEIQHMMDAEIAVGVAQGSFRTSAPLEAGRAIATMCTSVPQWFRPDGRLAPETIAREFTDFALGMLVCSRRRQCEVR